MGWTLVRISFLPLWLFAVSRLFLSGGCRKEPQGLSEVVQTHRVHDVIDGSRTAVSHCHCVLWRSLVSNILVLLERCKVSWMFTSLLVDFLFSQTHVQPVCSREKPVGLSFFHCPTHPYSNMQSIFLCLEWAHNNQL